MRTSRLERAVQAGFGDYFSREPEQRDVNHRYFFLCLKIPCTPEYSGLSGSFQKLMGGDPGDSWVFLGIPEGLAVQKMLDFTFIV